MMIFTILVLLLIFAIQSRRMCQCDPYNLYYNPISYFLRREILLATNSKTDFDKTMELVLLDTCYNICKWVPDHININLY